MRTLSAVHKDLFNRNSFGLFAHFFAFCALQPPAGAENEQGELQSLYGGQRLGANDPFPPLHSLPGQSLFDIPITPSARICSVGAGLYCVPDLKVTFPMAAGISSCIDRADRQN